MANLIVYSYNTGTTAEGWSVRWNGKGAISSKVEMAIRRGVYFKTKEEAEEWVIKMTH